MAINYTKVTWVNGAPPALSAQNLNHMDGGIKAATDALDQMAIPEEVLAERQAYRDESDPLFFKWQRGEATQEEWLAKVAEIKERYK